MDILSLVPAGSTGLTLLAVVVYFMRQNHLDRKQYRDDVAAIEARHMVEITAMNARHTTEMQAVSEKLTKLEQSNARVLGELEAERKLRWAAEDDAAKYRRQAQEARSE